MSSGDDTTPPDPLLFTNVPRRPRSAPRKEVPDDAGDPHPGPGGGIRSGAVSNNASPLVSNKRPASSTGGGVPRANKKLRLLAPIEDKDPEPEDVKDRGAVGALDRHRILGAIPPALSRKDKAAAAAAEAASSPSGSSSSEAEADVDWMEKKRCRKGKTPAVVNEDDAYRPHPAGSPGHAGNKLMGDAIRCHGRRSTTAMAGGGLLLNPSTRTNNPRNQQPAAAKTTKNRTKPKKEKLDSSKWFWCGSGPGRNDMSSAGSDVDHSFYSISVVSDRLRTILGGLGVTPPVRLYGRLLTDSDRKLHQARLQMSDKRWKQNNAVFPPSAFLTAEEKKLVKNDKDKGLELTAYDRNGDAYKLKLKYLKTNEAYRLVSQWSHFLKRNGLVVRKDEPVLVPVPVPVPVDDVMVDLWFFRTPGGEVRMVILHYRRGDGAAHADAALDEMEPKWIQPMLLNNGDAAVAAGMEDEDEDAGVKDEVMAATAVAEEQGGGALGEVVDAPAAAPSSSYGGAGRSDEVSAPLSSSLGGGGDGTEEEEEEKEAGGCASMAMVVEVEVEAATQSSSAGSNAGGGGAAPPSSSPEAAGAGAAAVVALLAPEDDEEQVVEAAALGWDEAELEAAEALLMLSMLQ